MSLRKRTRTLRRYRRLCQRRLVQSVVYRVTQPTGLTPEAMTTLESSGSIPRIRKRRQPPQCLLRRKLDALDALLAWQDKPICILRETKLTCSVSSHSQGLQSLKWLLGESRTLSRRLTPTKIDNS